VNRLLAGIDHTYVSTPKDLSSEEAHPIPSVQVHRAPDHDGRITSYELRIFIRPYLPTLSIFPSRFRKFHQFPSLSSPNLRQICLLETPSISRLIVPEV
jgi:hypothetical protein